MGTSYIHGTDLRPGDIVQAIIVKDRWIELDIPCTVTALDDWMCRSLAARRLRINRPQTATGAPFAGAGQVEPVGHSPAQAGSLPTSPDAIHGITSDQQAHIRAMFERTTGGAA